MMIAEKSQTAHEMIERISPRAPKASFVRDDVITAAMLFLEKNGFPNNKVEDYKYCNLDAILRREFKSPAQQFIDVADISSFRLSDAITIVVLNGKYSRQLSDKLIVNGLFISGLAELGSEKADLIGSIAKPDSDSFIAFNSIFCPDGLYLRVSKNSRIPMPVHIVYVNNAQGEAVVNSRSLIEIESGAELTLVEHFVSLSGKIFTNFVSEKFVGENAKLICASCQEEPESNFSVHTNQVNVAANAVYENTTVTLDGAVVRNNHNVVMRGQNAVTHLNGLFTPRAQQLVDNHTLMDHQVPHCESNELYKGVMKDKSTGVFNGKIYVRKDAQKTNAYQSSKNILLSDDATINTKPQLEIYADDVKCSHGTSTGRIDENAMFYLNARGIGKESARRLLLSSFVQDVIAKIPLESLRERVTAKVESIL